MTGKKQAGVTGRSKNFTIFCNLKLKKNIFANILLITLSYYLQSKVDILQMYLPMARNY